MTLYALDAIDDALDATRTFLWPFDRGRWARLALLMLFVGGVGGFNPVQFPGGSTGGGGVDAPAGADGPGALEAAPSIGGTEVAIIAAIFGVLLLLGLGFLFVGSVMEFVFVDSLRRETVTIRRYWGEHWSRGLRLFGFRLVLGVVSFALVGVVLVAAFAPIVFGDGGLSFGLLLAAIPVFAVVTIASGLVNGFTTMFVVPVMLGEETGVLSAWRRFWPTVTGQWKQYVAYAVMGFVLQLVGGILAGIATLVGAVVIAIPLGLVALAGAALLTVVEAAGWAVILVAAVVFGFALIALVLVVSVPVQTFLRYYALFVLGDTNETFDLIPDRRRAVRE
ncbi:DUF7544 domain-containing protein [Salinigranum marinum]|uniref:DUF7544 domain-containing protein n=1 Tax=Salinigranum marinum TaxID=1515595 RepID=UPI00298A0575|nr:hypothetical protein [Salinigranum marinum]